MPLTESEETQVVIARAVARDVGQSPGIDRFLDDIIKTSKDPQKDFVTFLKEEVKNEVGGHPGPVLMPELRGVVRSLVGHERAILGLGQWGAIVGGIASGLISAGGAVLTAKISASAMKKVAKIQAGTEEKKIAVQEKEAAAKKTEAEALLAQAKAATAAAQAALTAPVSYAGGTTAPATEYQTWAPEGTLSPATAAAAPATDALKTYFPFIVLGGAVLFVLLAVPMGKAEEKVKTALAVKRTRTRRKS